MAKQTNNALEEKVVQLLSEKNLTITTAESCTGGAVAAQLINVAGISALYQEGFITYSNEAKHKRLGVRLRTLNEFGAVSSETAFEMAKGVCQVAGADVSIVTTGIAGPDGGTAEKPVGLVYIGCCVNRRTKVIEKHFEGNRQDIREQTGEAALKLLIECLQLEG